MRLTVMSYSKPSGSFKSLLLLLAVVCFVLVTVGFSFASSGANDEIVWKKTDWFKVMNFSVLAVALFLLVRKPVAKALNGRIKGIEKDLRDLEAKKEEAEKQINECNKRIATLDKEAEKIISEYRRQGEEAKEKIMARARESVLKIEEQAKRNIANEFEMARQKLRQEIIGQAVERAEVLVKGKITSKDQDRLVEEYLSKVVLQ